MILTLLAIDLWFHWYWNWHLKQWNCCSFLPFLSGLQALKKFFSQPTRKFFCNVLNTLPTFFRIQIRLTKSYRLWLTTLDFKTRRLLGDIDLGLFASLRISAVKGLEFTINSTLVIKVLRDLLFKRINYEFAEVLLICFHNHEQDILRFLRTLPDFLFTTGETKCDY